MKEKQARKPEKGGKKRKTIWMERPMAVGSRTLDYLLLLTFPFVKPHISESYPFLTYPLDC